MRISAAMVMAIALTATSGAQQVLKEIQEDPYRAGGSYMAYRCVNQDNSPAPDGYEAFYISHYGRHGSRWLSRESDYTSVQEMLETAHRAGMLTGEGEDVYRKVCAVCEDAAGRAGALTPLGEEQHRGIAERMAGKYPEVFSGNADIAASSTTYPRCILSMAAFTERLKELNPGLHVTRQADMRSTRILNFFHNEANPEICDDFRRFVSDGKWKEDYADMASEYVRPERLMEALLKDPGFFSTGDSRKLMNGLYLLASDIQSTSLDGSIDLFGIFTDDELYLLNVYANYYFFVLDGPSDINGGAAEFYARILLEDIMDKADAAIAGNGSSADLRFGHDSSIIPLMTLLQFREFPFDRAETDPARVAEKWRLYEVTPMATNIQFIFFRPEDRSEAPSEDEILVKVLHNETAMHLPVKTRQWPYYRWSDVEKYYRGLTASLSYPSGGLCN